MKHPKALRPHRMTRHEALGAPRGPSLFALPRGPRPTGRTRGVLVALLFASALAGCAEDDPADAAAGPSATTLPPAGAPSEPASLRFEGRLTGASLGGEALTWQSEGFHRFEVPPGDPALTLEVAWSGTSPGGLSLDVRRGDGTHVRELPVSRSPQRFELEPGELPSGEASLSFGPPGEGASLEVVYRVSVAFSAH